MSSFCSNFHTLYVFSFDNLAARSIMDPFEDNYFNLECDTFTDFPASISYLIIIKIKHLGEVWCFVCRINFSKMF